MAVPNGSPIISTSDNGDEKPWLFLPEIHHLGAPEQTEPGTETALGANSLLICKASASTASLKPMEIDTKRSASPFLLRNTTASSFSPQIFSSFFTSYGSCVTFKP